MTIVTINYAAGISFDDLDLGTLILGTATIYTSNTFVVDYGNGVRDNFIGSGFTYDQQGGAITPTGGAITRYYISQNGSVVLDFSSTSMPVTTLVGYFQNNDTRGALSSLLAGNDTINGGSGPDTVYGFTGNDLIRGGGGSDTIDGGAGTDTVVLSGLATNYTITHLASGAYRVVDNRAGSPDGADTVTGVELVQYSNGTDALISSVAQTIRSQSATVLRADPLAGYNQAGFDAIVNAAEFSGLSSANQVARLVQLADPTTSVATLAYQFFTGRTPSAAGLDFLVSPTGSNANNLNSAYYAQFSATNRYINFASNLGKVGEGAASFQTAYGSLSLEQSLAKAYGVIFGSAPSADKISHLLHDLVPNGSAGTYERQSYFAFYGGDGLNGQGTKAAMVGWLLGEAASADIGSMQTANISYLTDVATGRASGSVDLIGVYKGTPYMGG